MAAVGVILTAQAETGRGAAPATAQEPRVTFTRDVAPIVFTSCATCHRPEGSAPFSLLTYGDAKAHADRIVAVTESRLMPPWKPEPGHGEFVGNRRLTDSQIATIRRWRDEGAVEGDPALLPKLPASTGRWQLGQPDLVLQTPVYTLRAAGDDMYRNFVLPISGTAARYIKAWEFLPGNPRVVHHATMQFDATGASRRLDAQDPAAGYEGLIPHGVQGPDGYFLDWGPGHAPYVAPDRMAWPLRPGTDLLMMLHLRPSGKEETVQATLGLYFSDTPPALTPTLLRLTRQHLDIAPGERRYVVKDTFTVNADVDIYTVQPHAHNLAREVRGFATLPDGREERLIYIRDWDFDWQGVFRYAKPVALPSGTTIHMEIVYDNSAENPNNPHSPPRRVTYGQRTTDEMAELWFQVVPRRESDRARLASAVREKVLREEIVGHEKMLEGEPGNVALHDGVALLHAEVGNLAGAAAHFAETLRVNPQSPAAHYNLGMALLMQHKHDEAGEHLANAVALNPDYALAHDALGLVRQAQGRLDEARAHFERAVKLNPDNALARRHLDEVRKLLQR
jgi:mono/diheme cytochrome c family protein